MKRYFWNILIGIDQFVNCIFAGYPDETLSSRMGKRVRDNKAKKLEIFLCKMLGKIEYDHCNESIEEDEGRQ